MKVFITGGSGFLGQAAVRFLVAQGHEVLALARSESSAAKLCNLGAQPVMGDLLDADLPPLSGVQVVVHAAAPVVFWAPWSVYQQEAVEASLAWYRHAATQGVGRFVHISSESVLQQGFEPLLDVDDTQPLANPPNSDYGRAKKEAELALRAESQSREGCALIILRPSFIWGPGMPALQTLLDKVRNGQFAWVDHGRSPFERVHVQNVAQAINCALTQGRTGAAYLLTDGVVGTVHDTLAPLMRAAGVTVPSRSMPSALARPLATTVEFIWRSLGLMNSAPPLTRFDLAFVCQPRRYRTEAARKELGYAPLAYVPGVTESGTQPAG